MTDLTETEVGFRRSVDRCTTTMHNHRIYLSEGDIYHRVYFHHCNIYNNAIGTNGISFKECVFHGCRFFSDDVEVGSILEMFEGNDLHIDDISRERCRNMGTSMYDPVADRLNERAAR